jgi:HKD family nuclease
MLDLAWNDEARSLAELLTTNIAQAKRIDIAVAFLNVNGLSLVENKLLAALNRGCEVRLFVGTDFYLTDPEALRRLERTFRERESGKLFLVGQNPRAMFHPKLYVFERDDQITAIVGSANMTEGGLRNNREACCIVSSTLGSEFHSKIQLLFAQCESAKDVKEASAWEIERYATEHYTLRKRVDDAEKKAIEEIKSIPELDEDTLQTRLAEYRANKREQTDYQTRLENYKQARRLLDELASGSVATEAQFRVIWERLIGGAGVDRLWHSDYMYRKGHRAVQSFSEVCRMVKAIRENESLSPRQLFELGQQYTRRINGIRVNVLTEMMNTYYPDKCAVLNRNPWASLRYFGLSKFPRPTSFKGHHYERFNDVMAYIKSLCGFESMGQADHFLNFVYWKYAKGSKG